MDDSYKNVSRETSSNNVNTKEQRLLKVNSFAGFYGYLV